MIARDGHTHHTRNDRPATQHSMQHYQKIQTRLRRDSDATQVRYGSLCVSQAGTVETKVNWKDCSMASAIACSRLQSLPSMRTLCSEHCPVMCAARTMCHELSAAAISKPDSPAKCKNSQSLKFESEVWNPDCADPECVRGLMGPDPYVQVERFVHLESWLNNKRRGLCGPGTS